MSNSARLIVASSMILLSATLASSQPPPPQPTGMLSPTNPVLFTQDGVPDGVGDLPALIQFVTPPTGGFGFLAANFGNIVCNGASSFGIAAAASQTGMPFDEFGRTPGEVMVDGFDTSDGAHPRPISAAFQEIGGGADGSAAMLDTDGDHVYERMTIAGNNGGGPVAAELDLKTFDADGDGKPEFVTLFDPAPADPQANLGVLQFFGLFCDNSPDLYTEAWIPVGRDLDGDPAIIGDLDGNGLADTEFYWGPKLGARGSVVQIPTLSGLGLAALAAVLLFAGLGLMRRRGLASGV